MNAVPFRKVALLGTGQIGGSVGLALGRLGMQVVGWDPHAESLRDALHLEAIGATADSVATAVSGADLVVVAAPPNATASLLRELSTDALVTDVASVKAPIVESSTHLRGFVGGHPMAGREQSGVRYASAGMFRGALWVLTTDGAADDKVEALAGLVDQLGAIPVRMTAAEHDRAVALVSHLPQLLATALMRMVARNPAAMNLAAGSFRDLTRVALSDSDWWGEVLSNNSEALQTTLAALDEEMSSWASVLDDQHAVESLVAQGRSARRSLAPGAVAVRVVLRDEPGEIARVGEALTISSVDVRDLQLRHAPHGGGGVLTLSVRPGESEVLRLALIDQGFVLED